MSEKVSTEFNIRISESLGYLARLGNSVRPHDISVISNSMVQWKVLNILKSFNLKPVRSIKFSFDPFSNRVRSIREVAFFLNYPKVLDTNNSIEMKIKVMCDRSDPTIDVQFVDETKTVYRTKNLSTLEILQHFHETCIRKGSQ